jgi:CBS domain containing-hemolysin-like protein
MHASSAELPRIFERGEVAIVVDAERHVQGILTKLDLIELLASRTQLSG